MVVFMFFNITNRLWKISGALCALTFLSACAIMPASILGGQEKRIDFSQLSDAQQKHYELSLHYIESGHYDVAASKLEAIILEYPTFPDVYNALGVVFERRGRVSNALASFLKAVEIYPEYDTAITNYGSLKCYLDGGSGILLDVATVESDRVKSRLYTVAARCYINKSDYENAYDAVQKAQHYDDTNAMSYLELAKIHLYRGSIEASRVALDRFNDLNGYNLESAQLGMTINRQLNDQVEVDKYQNVLATQFKDNAQE